MIQISPVRFLFVYVLALVAGFAAGWSVSESRSFFDRGPGFTDYDRKVLKAIKNETSHLRHRLADPEEQNVGPFEPNED